MRGGGQEGAQLDPPVGIAARVHFRDNRHPGPGGDQHADGGELAGLDLAAQFQATGGKDLAQLVIEPRIAAGVDDVLIDQILGRDFGLGGQAVPEGQNADRAHPHQFGFDRRAGAALAIRHNLKGWGISASAENGATQLFEETQIASLRGDSNRYAYNGAGLAVDREIGPAKLSFGANWMNESGTILGARFSEILGRNGSETVFLDGSAQIALGSGWSTGASWRQGWTWANQSQTVQRGSRLTSSAFLIDVAKRGMFAGNDHLALRVFQPLRVSSGGIALELPVAYDYATRSATFDKQTFNLAPSGREIASEIAWTVPFQGGHFSANGFWRQEPGHFASAPDDFGMAFRLSYGF